LVVAQLQQPVDRVAVRFIQMRLLSDRVHHNKVMPVELVVMSQGQTIAAVAQVVAQMQLVAQAQVEAVKAAMVAQVDTQPLPAH
jgi:hypothetical protein